MSYWIWIPFVTILYILQSWLTVKNNVHGGNWSWIYFFVSLFTPWVLISKHSKDLVFDAMIFDTILVVSYRSWIVVFYSCDG